MRILIVKTSSLGDIIHAFPVIAFLHQEFPQVKIDWVVEKSYADIIKAHPLLDEVIEMDTKGWRKGLLNFKTWVDILQFKCNLQKTKYDAVFDLQGNTKSAIPTFLAHSPSKVGFGLKTVHEWLNTLVTNQRINPPIQLNVRDENLYVVQCHFRCFSPVVNEKIILKLNDPQQKLHDEVWAKVSKTLKDSSGPKIMVCPGAAWKNKQLSDEALEVFLLNLYEHQRANIILTWGTCDELALAQRLQQALKGRSTILDKVPLPVLQNIMSKMDQVIAMDSLPLHLAGISGIPTFSVFGASSAQKYKPLGDLHQAIQGTCPYGRVFERRCPVLRSCSTGLCIRGLKGQELYKEFCIVQNVNDCKADQN